jgi:hypothetical protein
MSSPQALATIGKRVDARVTLGLDPDGPSRA